MIHLKKALSVLAVSFLLTLSSCAPNNGFTLIYASEEGGDEVTLEINKDTCEVKLEGPTYSSTNYCLKVVEFEKYDALGEYGDGPVFVYYFFYEPYFSQSSYLMVFYVPNNNEPFPDSRLKTTNWFFTF